MKVRAFVALDIDPSVRARIDELERELKPRVSRARFVPAANLHFTLRFLGESAPEQVGTIAGELEAAAARVPRFSLHVKGCGAFPHARRPRVLWIGVERPPDALYELQRAVESIARRAGFAPETRRFEPHLTIARFREPIRGLEDVLASAEDRDLGTSAIHDVVVYESRLSPRGATYRPLHRFVLCGSSGTDGKRLV